MYYGAVAATWCFCQLRIAKQFHIIWGLTLSKSSRGGKGLFAKGALSA